MGRPSGKEGQEQTDVTQPPLMLLKVVKRKLGKERTIADADAIWSKVHRMHKLLKELLS